MAMPEVNTANAVSPGLVNTEFNRSTTGLFKVVFTITKLFARDARAGADTAIWAAASPEVEAQSGKFWQDRKEKVCKYRDPVAVDRLWELCESQVASAAERSQRPAA